MPAFQIKFINFETDRSFEFFGFIIHLKNKLLIFCFFKIIVLS